MSDRIKVEEVEARLLRMPQAECPVVHHFGPGIYVREVTMPAGADVVGHRQKLKQMNIMLTGKIAMVSEDGVKELTAPMIFTGGPGQKMGHVIEDCTWLNVYATDETDIDKLETKLLDKSEAWADQDKKGRDLREEDRLDFQKMLKETGFSAEKVRSQSENEEDRINLPLYGFLSVRNSVIEGRGVFAGCSLPKGFEVGLARVGGMRTKLGRYVNHSKAPNSVFKRDGTKDITLVTIREVFGCRGGDLGEELTVDYRQALLLNKEISCQA